MGRGTKPKSWIRAAVSGSKNCNFFDDAVRTKTRLSLLQDSMPSNVSDGTSMNRKKWVVVVVVVVGLVLLTLVLGLGLGLGLDRRDRDAPATDHLRRRIDCYPETRWGSGTVDRVDCERRGCQYDPTSKYVDSKAPVCFVSADGALGAGYTVKEVDRRSDGLKARLQTNYLDRTSDVFIKPLNVVLEVEYAGENVLHIKVCCNRTHRISRVEDTRTYSIFERYVRTLRYSILAYT